MSPDLFSWSSPEANFPEFLMLRGAARMEYSSPGTLLQFNPGEGRCSVFLTCHNHACRQRAVMMRSDLIRV